MGFDDLLELGAKHRGPDRADDYWHDDDQNYTHAHDHHGDIKYQILQKLKADPKFRVIFIIAAIIIIMVVAGVIILLLPCS